MGALLPLCISFVGIVALILFKYWENKAGRVHFPFVRERADRFVLRVASFLERGVQKVLRAFSRKVVVGGLQFIAERILWSLQWIEKRLLTIISVIRVDKTRFTSQQKPPVKPSAKPSALHRLHRSSLTSDQQEREKKKIE